MIPLRPTILLLAGVWGSSCRTPPISLPLRPVGFRIETLELGQDSIALLRWYPATGPGRRVTPLDYISAPVCGPGPASDLALATYVTDLEQALELAIDRRALRAALTTPQLAVLNAPPDTADLGSVVLLLSGLQAAPWYHAPLAERLAAAGHEVVAWQRCGQSGGGFDVPTTRRGAEDAGAVRRRLGHSGRPVALVAWSFGGVTSGLLASEDSSYQALVSLDAGLSYAYGEALLRDAGVRPDVLRLPLLQLSAGITGPVARSRWLIDSAVRAPRMEVTVLGQAHAGFAAPYGSWFPAGDSAARPVEESERLERMSQLIVEFLAAADSGDPLGVATPAGWPVTRSPAD